MSEPPPKQPRRRGRGVAWVRSIASTSRPSASSQVRLHQRAGAVAGRRADQRAGQPLGVVEQLGGRPALGAQAAACWSGSRPARGWPGGRPRSRHAALQRAVGAVRPRRPQTGSRRGGAGTALRARVETGAASFRHGRTGVNVVFRRPHRAAVAAVRPTSAGAGAWSDGRVTRADRPTATTIRRGGRRRPARRAAGRPADRRDAHLASADSRWTRWALPEDGRMQRLTRWHELAAHRGVSTRTAPGSPRTSTPSPCGTPRTTRPAPLPCRPTSARRWTASCRTWRRPLRTVVAETDRPGRPGPARRTRTGGCCTSPSARRRVAGAWRPRCWRRPWSAATRRDCPPSRSPTAGRRWATCAAPASG